MKIVEPSYEILKLDDGLEVLKRIERAARTCYQSEDKITDGSALAFVKRLLSHKPAHLSVIEHENMTVKFVCDRGVTHELVRHRLASYSQKSTRYVSSVESPMMVPENMDDAIEMYERGISMKKIAERAEYRFTEWEIYKELEQRGIVRRPRGNRGLRNQSAFDSIDTPEKAYIMGMLLADGSVRHDAPQVLLTQHKAISWYLKVMLEQILGGPISVGDDGDCHSLTFSGRQLRDAIWYKGIVPNKTIDITEHDVDKLAAAVDMYIGDFLRGLMDGDGYVRFFRQRAETSEKGSAQLGFTGQEPVMNWVALLIHKLIGYPAKVARVSGTDNLWRVLVSDKEKVVELCRIMYSNFVFPYGNPVKTARVYAEVTGLPLRYAEWNDGLFKAIKPCFWEHMSRNLWVWAESMDQAEHSYRRLRELGAKPEEARSVLPNSIETEIVATANLRQWGHIFFQRTSPRAHPQMRQLMVPLCDEVQARVPVLFDDISIYS